MIDQAVDVGAGLASAIASARARAAALGRPVMVSRTERLPWLDPLDLLAGGSERGLEQTYWERPDEGLSMVGLGVAWAYEGAGDGRFEAAARAWTALVADALPGRGAGAAGPRLLGGFSFDPDGPSSQLWRGFPAARLTLPRLLVTRRGEACWLTASLLVEAGADPDETADALERDLAALRCRAAAGRAPVAEVGPRQRPDAGARPAVDLQPAERWRSSVAAATDAIRRGEAEKIVLARAVQVEAGRRFDVAPALARLRAAYSTCALFALSNRAGCFLGATPERLVRLSDGEVQVSCLAGTIARGGTAEEDERLGAELLGSHKNRQEHDLVVQELVEQLADGVVDLDVPAQPALMKVRNVQHLHTPLRGRLAPGGGLLELAGRLHPTPAVGGRPRAAALRFIRAHEGLDRGWYAGPVGWIDARGDGEMVVALRSALVRAADGGGSATLFAGCGIVAESDPASEYAESELKLAPMLGALGGE